MRPLLKGMKGRPLTGRGGQARAGNTFPGRRETPIQTVHPRSRGEHLKAETAVLRDAGSSPLARGTPLRPDVGLCVVRFIPARAGNTSRVAAPACGPSVHPRSRGEHCPSSPIRIRLPGSSPLARGTRHHGHPPAERRRFIPARAGNTHLARDGITVGSVHPRSRGEHAPAQDLWGAFSGSSPLARGTRGILPVRPGPRRFIPARAGNTNTTASSRAWRPVHPRSRGEHRAANCCRSRTNGSSPLARGTLPRRGPVADAHRFIPARAGNTAASARSARFSPVHPRSRGEHRTSKAAFSSAGGSSPLARGTLVFCPLPELVERFIPARAGNTSGSSGCSSAVAVHPRSRGEHARGCR